MLLMLVLLGSFIPVLLNYVLFQFTLTDPLSSWLRVRFKERMLEHLAYTAYICVLVSV